MISEILCAAVMSMGLPRAHVACNYMDLITEESKKNDLDPALVIALIRAESRFKVDAVSRANACGLMQVLPKYTKNPKLSCEQLKDPSTNITTGTKKLKFWIYKYGRGNISTGLCGYNAGFRCKGKNKNATGVRYAKKVLLYKRKIKRKYNKIFKGLKSL